MSGGGISAFAYTDNNPRRWVDPFGLTARPPRCPSARQDVSRSQLERLIGSVSPTDSANLDRGCIGMASAYQGMNVTFPETAPGTQCFNTQAEAQARTCPSGQKKFTFAKQGQYEHGSPTPGPNGQVPNDTISNAGGHYNYVGAFPGGCYGWMNNAISRPGQSARPADGEHWASLSQRDSLPPHDLVLDVSEFTIGDEIKLITGPLHFRRFTASSSS